MRYPLLSIRLASNKQNIDNQLLLIWMYRNGPANDNSTLWKGEHKI